MPVCSIYHNAVVTEFDLPCSQEGCRSLQGTGQESVRVSYTDCPGSEFNSVHWIGRRYGGAIRTYDVGDGVLVCAGESVRLHIRRDNVIVHYPPVNHLDSDCLATSYDLAHNRSYAAALLVNLGLSVCSLLHGRLAIHGAAAIMDGKMVGILAASGTGKTTLLWEALESGAMFATDDVFTVRSVGSAVLMTPSISLHAKLSMDVLGNMGLNWMDYEEMLPGSGEFWIPIPPERRVTNERPLDAIFVLQPTADEGGQDVAVLRAAGGTAIALLMENTQGLWACYPKLDAQNVFALYTAIEAAVPMFVLRYPRRIDMLPRLVEIIRRTAQTGRSHG